MQDAGYRIQDTGCRIQDAGYRIQDSRIGRRYVPVRDGFPFSIIDGYCTYTAKTKYRNFETNIPRKGISGSQSQFPHSCICERFLYSHDQSAYSAGGYM